MHDTDTGSYAKLVALEDALRAFLDDLWVTPHLMDDGSLDAALARIMTAISDEVTLNHS